LGLVRRYLRLGRVRSRRQRDRRDQGVQPEE
jgi:hypothetical protein